MKTIFKYAVESDVTLLLPEGAHVVLFNRDYSGTRSMWVELDASPGIEKVPRSFRVHGTGGRIGDNDLHHGSFVAPDGYVWHLYETF